MGEAVRPMTLGKTAARLSEYLWHFAEKVATTNTPQIDADASK